jgi:hypothetical protein
MLISGIFLFIIFVIVVSLFLRYRGVRLAYLWLLLMVSAFLIWLILMITQPSKISPLVIENWVMIGDSPVNLIFQMNTSNWPISITLFSFLIAFLLTSITRVKGNHSLFEWVEISILIVSGWIVLMAGDYWSILIGWTLIDFVELIIHFHHKGLNPEKFYSHFLIKFLGSLILIFGISRSFQINPFELFEKKVEWIGILIPIAAFLHSGLFSNYSEKSNPEINLNSMVVFLRIITFITSFFLLIYVPAPNLKFPLNIVIKIVLFTVAVFQMYGWASEKNIFIQGRKFLLAFGTVLCLMFFSGSGKFIEIWLILSIVPFGWLYLFTDRESKLQIFVFILGLLLSGLLYSLTFNGLFQLSQQRQWMDLLFIQIPMTLALSGFINHALKKKGDFYSIEPWYQLFYLIGLLFPLLSTIAIIIRISNPYVDFIRSWWIGFVMILLAFFIYYFHLRNNISKNKLRFLQTRNKKWKTTLIVSLKFIVNKIYFMMENALQFFSSLFENNGGILWSIVFLVLFVTILNFQGAK